MRFSYLRHSPPDAIERLRALRIAPELQAPLSALVTACAVILGWWCLERHWIAVARLEEARALAHLQDSRNAFAATKIVRADVNRLLALDARLRRIRVSGSVVARSVVRIADELPKRAWLTSITPFQSGLELQGYAAGLDTLSETVKRLDRRGSAPVLVRAAGEDRSPAFLSFTVRIGDRSL